MDDSDKIILQSQQVIALQEVNQILIAKNEKLTAERDALLAKLEAKGTITKEESDEIKAAEVAP